jgi:hypothetical protein
VPVTEFDPAAHPPLTELGARLAELAGAAAYKAGRDYLRKGNVRDATVSATAAYATVKGSTSYRVTIAFPSVETTKVTCTCPAHRRNKHCKHVVAVCTALIEQPASFAVVDAPPEPPAPTRAPRKRGPAAPKVDPAERRAAGLGVLDRLLTELTDGGLAQLGPEKAALIEQCAELVRALKLRRLGNLLMQLQRVVAPTVAAWSAGGAGWPTGSQMTGAQLAMVVPSAVASARAVAETRAASEFPRLLLELYLCRTAVGAHLDEASALDPRLAEDLFGKTWRAEELEMVSGLELVQVAATHENDGEFAITSSYLVDLGSLEVYAERQITPARLRGATPLTPHRVRLLVEDAGLYPGLSPRRIRLGHYERAALRDCDIERIVTGAADDVSEVRRLLVERMAVPFGPSEVAVLFRPAMLLGAPAGTPDQVLQAGAPAGAVDAAGRFIALDWRPLWQAGLKTTPPPDQDYAIFGLAALDATGVTLRCLSIIGARAIPSWTRGTPGHIFPAI